MSKFVLLQEVIRKVKRDVKHDIKSGYNGDCVVKLGDGMSGIKYVLFYIYYYLPIY